MKLAQNLITPSSTKACKKTKYKRHKTKQRIEIETTIPLEITVILTTATDTYSVDSSDEEMLKIETCRLRWNKSKKK